MSIVARLDDAQVLYEAGRLEGALLSLLVATAATSRKRYPHGSGMGDRAAFTAFMSDEMGNLTGSISNVRMPNVTIGFRGKMMPLSDILYTYVRCELAHEARLPGDIVFLRDDFLLFKGGDQLVLNEMFLQGLANVVLGAPENTAELGTTVALGVRAVAESPAGTGPGSKLLACLIGLPLDLRTPVVYDEKHRTTFGKKAVTP